MAFIYIYMGMTSHMILSYCCQLKRTKQNGRIVTQNIRLLMTELNRVSDRDRLCVLEQTLFWCSVMKCSRSDRSVTLPWEREAERRRKHLHLWRNELHQCSHSQKDPGEQRRSGTQRFIFWMRACVCVRARAVRFCLCLEELMREDGLLTVSSQGPNEIKTQYVWFFKKHFTLHRA